MEYTKNDFNNFRNYEEGFYMMATTAIHMLGDISRDQIDLCYITGEDEFDNYVGQWTTGFGYVCVKFPKSTTRKLTKEEVEKYNSTYIQLANYDPQKLKVD